MFTALIILSSLLASSSAIINGTIPHRFRYPFVVSLQWDGHHKCGGALLNADTILTVAHCYPLIWVDPHQQHRVTALLGTRNQLTRHKATSRRVGIRRIIWPDNFEEKYKSMLIMRVPLNYVPNDYMILKTNSSIMPFGSIGYVRLGSDLAGNYVPKVGDRCVPIGWGRYKSPDSDNATAEIFPRYVRRGLVEIANDSLCFGEELPIRSMMCAKQVIKNGDPKGMPCFGDSGSPLVCKNGGGEEYLAGLVEAGRTPCNHKNAGSFFMRISSVRYWIEKNL